jgi:hypothetical protein
MGLCVLNHAAMSPVPRLIAPLASRRWRRSSSRSFLLRVLLRLRGTISAIGVSRSYYDDRAARTDVIEIARETVAQFRDFGFFHDFWIIAKLALSGYEVNAPQRGSRSRRKKFRQGGRLEADPDVEGAELRV